MRAWISGIISAAMGGASGVLGMLVADPQNFDMDHWQKIFKVALIVSSHTLWPTSPRARCRSSQS